MNEEKISRLLEAVERHTDTLSQEIQRNGGKIGNNVLDQLDKTAHIMKSLYCVMDMMGGDGYSQDGGPSGYSGRRGRSRTTGRFVSRDGGNSMGGSMDGGSMRGSYDGGSSYGSGGHREMIQHMRQMLDQMENQ